jgi:hypothetical protein
MKTLVGSSALKKHFGDFYRKVDDVDYFSDTDVEGADVFYHPDLEKWSWGNIATADELYTIKVSHSFWELRNKSWSKHLRDIEFMQAKDCFFISELHEILYPIWEEVHGPKETDYTLHGAPLFNEIMGSTLDASKDKSKFDELSHENRLQFARDSISKRLGSNGDADASRQTALQDTVTNFGNNWFPLFVVLNWRELNSEN